MTITHPATLLAEIARAKPGTQINYNGPTIEIEQRGHRIIGVKDVTVVALTPAIIIGGAQLTLDDCSQLRFRNFAFRFAHNNSVGNLFDRADGKVVTRGDVSAWVQNGRCVHITETCAYCAFENCSFGMGTDDLVSDYSGTTFFGRCLFGPGLLPGSKGSLHPNGALFGSCVWSGCEYRTPKVNGKIGMTYCISAGFTSPCEWSGAYGSVVRSWFAPSKWMLQRPVVMTSDHRKIRFTGCTPRWPVGLPGRADTDAANIPPPIPDDIQPRTDREALDIIAHAGPAWSDPIDEYARRLARWHCGLTTV